MSKYIKKILIVIIAVVINVGLRLFAQKFSLPVWFDMTGTLLASYYAGLWGGIIAAVSNNIIFWIMNVSPLVYVLTGIAGAVFINIIIKKGYLHNPFKGVVSSFWLGVICTAVSTPLNLIFNDGYTGNIWGDALIDMMLWKDISLVLSAIAGDAVVEIIDKQLCVLSAFLIIYLLNKITHSKEAVKKTAALALVGILALGMLPESLTANAMARSIDTDNFVEEIYDNSNGTVSSEANVICETDDGYIWVGSYAGLSRYDGNQFEFVLEGGLVNVVGMMTDDKGRLWIGTNDAGIARYENGKYTYFTEKDGLPTDSIRCFAQDSKGNVYVGTSGKMCVFTPQDEIIVLDSDIMFVKAMIVYKDMLIAMDNNGGIYALNTEKTLTVNDEYKNYFYYCMALTSDGLMVGTDSGELFLMDLSADEISVIEEYEIDAMQISAIFEDSKNRVWIATESDFGHFNNNIYNKMHFDGFEGAIVYFHEDYQGNIWLASSHYGVMKLSETAFVNMFDKINVEKQVVNAVTLYDGNYFCGTDTGLVVIKNETVSDEYSELSQMLSGTRVRSSFVDKDYNLWICSYNGLYRCDTEGNIRVYCMESDSATSDRFRCINQLSDGTIVAGTADGINILINDEITTTLTKADGLMNTQILSVSQSNNGTIWAGSDGSGIYEISNGKLVKTYTVNDGLSSNIILRLVPYEDKMLVVTSNALCVINSEGQIKKLDKFPYFNNYDIIIIDDTAYVTCSSGLYKLNASQLCDNDMKGIVHYGAREVLFSGLTDNSWNYVAPDGSLYLCSNNGVTLFNGAEKQQTESVKFSVTSAQYDDKIVDVTEDKIVIPAKTKNISLYASVRNYAFEDLKVKFYVKELDENPKLYSWSEVEPIKLFKPKNSSYTVCLEIYDSTGENLIDSRNYQLSKDVELWEKPVFKSYLVIVLSEISLFTIISIASMIIFVTRKNELEKLQVILENKVDEQTKELVLQQKTIEKHFIQTVTALSEAVDAKDRYTSGHSKRVAEYSKMLASEMGMSKEEQDEIYRAGLLHDVGKIRIPVDIINKAGKLTDDEYNIIKIHSVTGYHILKGISGSKRISLAAKHHHERYDGNGYPNGLQGEKIPLEARILAVADAYDAMTSDRSYRKALPQDVVRQEFVDGLGKQFDPKIAQIMISLIDEDNSYSMKQLDSLQRSVIVVDDEAETIDTIKEIMSDEPMYKLSSVSNICDALDAISQNHFDLILLDVKLPDEDVFDNIRKIREKYHIPIVVMTSAKSLDMSNGFTDLGCDDFITKPFNPIMFKEIVHYTTQKPIFDQ